MSNNTEIQNNQGLEEIRKIQREFFTPTSEVEVQGSQFDEDPVIEEEFKS